jgi:hypothetical protein
MNYRMARRRTNKVASRATPLAADAKDQSTRLKGRPLSTRELSELMAELSSTVETVNGREVKYFILPRYSGASSASVAKFAKAVARDCPS